MRKNPAVPSLTGGRVITVYTDKLPVRLTDEELLERGAALARIDADVRDQKDKAESIKKKLKAEESELEAKRALIASVIRARSEIRDIDVQVEQDPDNKRFVLEVRVDSGDVVRKRPIRPEEQQTELPLPAPEDPEQQDDES